MRRFLAPVALVAFAAACGGAAPSGNAPAMTEPPSPQNPPPAPPAATGMWSLTSGTAPACRLALQSLPVPGGYGVHLEQCEGGPAARTRLWRVRDGTVELVADDGRVLVRLRQHNLNLWVGETAEGQAVRMASSPEF